MSIESGYEEHLKQEIKRILDELYQCYVLPLSDEDDPLAAKVERSFQALIKRIDDIEPQKVGKAVDEISRLVSAYLVKFAQVVQDDELARAVQDYREMYVLDDMDQAVIKPRSARMLH